MDDADTSLTMFSLVNLIVCMRVGTCIGEVAGLAIISGVSLVCFTIGWVALLIRCIGWLDVSRRAH